LVKANASSTSKGSKTQVAADMRTEGETKFSARKAHETQRILSLRIIRQDRLPREVRYVGGADVAFGDGYSIGAVAVLDYESLKLAEVRTAVVKTRIPYIPTLLAFREVPPVVSAFKLLSTIPDVLLVDGHGLAHPYHMGFASHLGIVLPVPTIGVAKSLLCGEVKTFEDRKGWRPIVHEGEVVGAEVLTVKRAKPIYVSIGNKVSLERAVEIVSHSVQPLGSAWSESKGGRFRVPEPIRQAHLAANREKNRILMTKSPSQ